MLDDCRDDPDVGLTEANRSRPPLDKAIRHPDGRMISQGEWNAIKTSARMIRYELRQLPAVSNRRGKGTQRRTKTFYRTYHPREWTDAIRRLESMQPLLALCANNWKADHVLGNSLLAADDDGEHGDNTEDHNGNNNAPSAGSIKPPSPGKSKKKRKAKDVAKGGPDTTTVRKYWHVYLFS